MSTLATNAITDASGGNTATINSYTPTESNMAGRNRIINGDMRIDQRNAGAAVNSVAASNVFCVDRWKAYSTSPAAFSMQQVADAPAGFNNSVKITVTGTDTSLAASDFNAFRYIIEGFNVADLGWGTAAAQAVTISFRVRSSLTGTFSVSVRNSAVDRGYIATYSITAADTWETKTITIPGDTSGTWLKTNGEGIRLDWALGCGSDFQGTASAWTATNDMTTAGTVSVVGTSGATFYLTGVQLEEGSVATPFEHRPYGQELALCQRYCHNITGITGYKLIGSAQAIDGSSYFTTIPLPVPMRAAPSVSTNGGSVFANESADFVPVLNPVWNVNNLVHLHYQNKGSPPTWGALRGGRTGSITYLLFSSEL